MVATLTPDAVLIELSWREPERFAELFDRYYGDIHGYAARRVGAKGQVAVVERLDTAIVGEAGERR